MYKQTSNTTVPRGRGGDKVISGHHQEGKIWISGHQRKSEESTNSPDILILFCFQ